MQEAAYGIEIALFWLLALTAVASARLPSRRWFKTLYLASMAGCMLMVLIWTFRWAVERWMAG